MAIPKPGNPPASPPQSDKVTPPTPTAPRSPGPPPLPPGAVKAAMDAVRKHLAENPHAANVAVGHPGVDLVPGNVDAIVQVIETLLPYILQAYHAYEDWKHPKPAPKPAPVVPTPDGPRPGAPAPAYFADAEHPGGYPQPRPDRPAAGAEKHPAQKPYPVERP